MKIKLDDVIEALEFVSDEMDAYFNPETYEIIYLGDFMDISEEEREKIYYRFTCQRRY